jgi:hypothetical protein
MKKYMVVQIAEYELTQEIEAETEEEAMQLAQEYDNWSDPISTDWTMQVQEIKEKE